MDEKKEWRTRVTNYKSNNSTMCSVLLEQRDPALHAMLETTEDLEANKSNLLFVLEAVEVGHITVQENFSLCIVACEALRSFANCFQNSEEPLGFKCISLACIHKLDKAGIGFRFGKKFLDPEKAKNPNLADDGTVTKAAKNCLYGTMWLMNSTVYESVTNNLVQDYCTGTDKYPSSVDKAFALVAAFNQRAPSGRRRTTTSLVQRVQSQSWRSQWWQQTWRYWS